MKKFLLYSLTLLLINISCNPAANRGPRPTPVVRDSEYCYDAEENLKWLKCEEGKPTKGGKRFAVFCIETQDNGIFINPLCLSKIKDCSEVDTCTRSK